MAEIERKREPIRSLPGEDYWQEMERDGWRAVAIEWEREGTIGSKKVLVEELPYGLQVGEDCRHLEECADEVEILSQILEMLTEDVPLSKIAGRLSTAGKRDRDGRRWTQTKIFELLPRVIEVAPQLYSGREKGTARRPQAVD